MTEDGFSVQTHKYYRQAVKELGLTMKSFQYELDLRATEEDAAQLRTYLEQHLRPGETAELWNLWVGDVYKRQALDLARRWLSGLPLED